MLEGVRAAHNMNHHQPLLFLAHISLPQANRLLPSPSFPPKALSRLRFALLALHWKHFPGLPLNPDRVLTPEIPSFACLSRAVKGHPGAARAWSTPRWDVYLCSPFACTTKGREIAGR